MNQFLCGLRHVKSNPQILRSADNAELQSTISSENSKMILFSTPVPVICMKILNYVRRHSISLMIYVDWL